MYPKLTQPYSIVFVELFHMNILTKEASYVETLLGVWSELGAKIENAFSKTNFGKLNVKASIMKPDGSFDAFDDLCNIFSVFKHGLKQIITVFIRSNESGNIIILLFSFLSLFILVSLRYGKRLLSLDLVPEATKSIIAKFLAMKEPVDEIMAQIYRRILLICYNGGIPTHLFDKFKFDKDAGTIGSDHFDRVYINFSDLQKFERNISTLIYPKVSLKSQLFRSSSEYTLRSLFWDIVIGDLFCDVSSVSESPGLFELSHGGNYRLVSEWALKSLFTEADTRFVDFVALSTIDGVDFPILLVEAGKEPFEGNTGHKDFSKLMGMLSIDCIKLAHKLEEIGKGAELSRVYGIWIGGLSAQLCVAQAVVNLVDGKHQIHCNLSFFPEWKMDLDSKTTSPSSQTSSFHSDIFQDDQLEAVIKGNPSIFLKSLPPNIEGRESIDLAEEEEDEEEESGKQAKLDPSSPLLEGDINVDTLLKLKCFIECVKRRISLIHESEVKTEKRDFASENPDTAIAASVPLKTPAKQTLGGMEFKFNTEALAGPSCALDFNTHKKVKDSLTEFHLYRRLTKFPMFPRVYKAVRDLEDSNLFVYSFEKMRPLMLSKYKIDFELFCHDSYALTLFECLRFTLHCLYGLHVLHDDFGIVHSDVSPWNIHFSTIEDGGIWKLDDFDHSMGVEESLKNSRKAGTVGFISPESESSGIFTVQSDVYSLGRVIANSVYPVILTQIPDLESCETESLEDEEFRSVLFSTTSDFERLFKSMMRSDPAERPTVANSLRAAFNAITKLLNVKELIKSSNIFNQIHFIVTQMNFDDEISATATSLKKVIIKEEKATIIEMKEPTQKDVFVPNIMQK
jgi:serine/threonine protein kinase